MEIKNPFSPFEFFGYLFPGALSLSIINVLINDKDLTCLLSWKPQFISYANIFGFDKIIFVILISYVLGHLVSYISSLTIEQFSIWLYGYPSEFLLKEVNIRRYIDVSDGESFRIRLTRICWRILIALLLLPLTFCSFVFSECCGVKFLFLKKLDKNLISTISVKAFYFASYLHYKFDENNTDLHRAINHYEYEHLSAHQEKINNYVALYDFLRAVTLIINCLFLYVLMFVAIPSINFSADIDLKIIILLVALMFLTYLFFMGFMKFYRRYTLENFMCLVIDNSYMPKSIKGYPKDAVIKPADDVE